MACDAPRQYRLRFGSHVFLRADATYTADVTVRAGTIERHHTQVITGWDSLTEEQIADVENYPPSIVIDESDFPDGHVGGPAKLVNVTVTLTAASAANLNAGSIRIEAVDGLEFNISTYDQNGEPILGESCYPAEYGLWCLVDGGVSITTKGYGLFRQFSVCVANVTVTGACCEEPGQLPVPGEPDYPGFPGPPGDPEDPGFPEEPVEPEPPPIGPGSGGVSCRREFITSLLSIDTEDGATRLMAGTRSRLYCSTGDGNFQLLRSLPQLCLDTTDNSQEEVTVPDGRFRMASIGNMVFAAHSESGFWTWSPGSIMTLEPDGYWHSAEPVDDLIALDISQARAVASSNGFVMIGNVVEEGQRKPGLLIWSDYNDPRTWRPGGESLAKQNDFGPGEQILAIVNFAKGVRIFTRMSIWAGVLVDSEEIWHFDRIYTATDDARGSVLAYPNSIIKIDDTLLFLGQACIMALGSTDRAPRRIEFLDGCGAAIYRGVQERWLRDLPAGILEAQAPIDSSAIQSVTGAYFAAENLALFCWATKTDGGIPSLTLAVDLERGFACLVDYGFTAATCESTSTRRTLRRFLADEGICPGTPEINEGNPLPIAFTQASYPYLVFEGEQTGKFPEFDLRGVDLLTNPNGSAGWVATMMREGRCCIECPDRSAALETVLASAHDKCLKHVTTETYVRELVAVTEYFNWPDETGSEAGINRSSNPNHPTVDLDLDNRSEVPHVQFASLWQSDTIPGTSPKAKTIGSIGVQYESHPLAAPEGLDSTPVFLGVRTDREWLLYCQAAGGYNSGCMNWASDDGLVIVCRVDEPAREDVPEYDGGIEPMAFRFNERGQFLAWRFFCGGRGAGVEPVGPLAITGVTVGADPASSRW